MQSETHQEMPASLPGSWLPARIPASASRRNTSQRKLASYCHLKCLFYGRALFDCHHTRVSMAIVDPRGQRRSEVEEFLFSYFSEAGKRLLPPSNRVLSPVICQSAISISWWEISQREMSENSLPDSSIAFYHSESLPAKSGRFHRTGATQSAFQSPRFSQILLDSHSTCSTVSTS